MAQRSEAAIANNVNCCSSGPNQVAALAQATSTGQSISLLGLFGAEE